MKINGETYHQKLISVKEAFKIYMGQKKNNKTTIILSINFSQNQEVIVTAILQGYSETEFSLTYEEYLRSCNYMYHQKIKVDSNTFTTSIQATFDLQQSGEKFFQSVEIIGSEVLEWEEKILSIRKQKYSMRLKPENVNQIVSNGRFVREIDFAYTLNDPYTPNTVMSGNYFAHFFMPEALLAMPMHVIFVIDVSASMRDDNRLAITKNAMCTFLGALRKIDHFHIVTFSTWVSTWPDEYPQNSKPIRTAAHEFVASLSADGQSNLNGGLRVAMQIAKKFRSSSLYTSDTRQLIFFMTDGEPNVEERSPFGILRNMKSHELSIPVHGFAFGSDATFNLVQFICLGMKGKVQR